MIGNKVINYNIYSYLPKKNIFFSTDSFVVNEVMYISMRDNICIVCVCMSVNLIIEWLSVQFEYFEFCSLCMCESFDFRVYINIYLHLLNVIITRSESNVMTLIILLFFFLEIIYQLWTDTIRCLRNPELQNIDQLFLV